MKDKRYQSLQILNIAQMLSAFADNAIFFVILGLLASKGFSDPEGEMVMVQAGFLLAYVLLAPFVGTFADKHRKSHVLVVGNLIKAAGVGLLFSGISPAVSYALIGLGAVVYSPAKYGVLVEICKDAIQMLMKANAKLESSTIAAILLGTLAGGFLATFSPSMGMLVCMALYVISIALAPFIICDEGNSKLRYGSSAREFLREVRWMMSRPTLRFSLFGTSAFWMTSAVLRIAFLMWLSQYLQVTDPFQQSMVVGITGVGIVIGAILAPKLVPIAKFHQSYLFGFLMVVVIVLAVIPIHVYLTAVLLLLVGVFGAVFIIPMNTIVQDEGKRMVGSGKTIAIQNFCENILMLSGIGIFQYLLSVGLDVQIAILIIGAILGGFVVYIRSLVSQFNGEIHDQEMRSVSSR
ncbi:lysophospholipid transporter LplT [Ammoniphilus sp. CFH 90114]|uniref:lysophospholipid transporter LplT n=1 Tax=Ammoniphilus sp. CFH 90114 TaxID=2493665 RepID=UPI00100E0753|nr:lysophospholipid transporter LplT [Ammoniphilus sp. CFH 90114]RXT03842.1 lysophospholipid transporter LplT [Ammoniphilus sp. CFH 90114]